MYDRAGLSVLEASILRDEDGCEVRSEFEATKRKFDIVVSLLLLPLLVVATVTLFVLNPFFNRGPVFFVQTRMGRGCVPFAAIKFRSMRVAARIYRSSECPLEEERITPLGRFIRKTRIDELPQILNVLRGEMSLIGPRPDYIVHAQKYLQEIPGYRQRHAVRPGISGLAQTEVGYVTGVSGTRRKVMADLYYIRNCDVRMEAWIVWRTLAVILARKGA